MDSQKRSDEELKEILKKMNNKAVYKQLVENISVSKNIVNIPKDQPNSDEKEKLVDDDNFIKSCSIKVQQSPKIKKDVAKNVSLSAQKYKKEKEKVADGANNAPNNTDMAANYPLPEGTVIVHKFKENNIDKEQHYIIGRCLQQGGCGMTYIATYPGEKQGCKVVIKELYPFNGYRRIATNQIDWSWDNNGQAKKDYEHQFGKETKRIDELIAKHNGNVNNFNLVIPKTTVFECFGNLYYVMEFVNGNSLTNIINSFQDNKQSMVLLPMSCRLQIMEQLCNAINNLHSIHCVHHDISPNNVMVDFDNEGNVQLKVIDYGLATNLNESINISVSEFRQGGTGCFTDTFDKVMEDEYKKADKSKQKLIDIFSLGAVLGYLCFLDINFIKRKDFSSKYSDMLRKKTYYYQHNIEDNDENDVIAAKLQLNLIIKLVHDATNMNLNDRIQTVENFRERLDEIINTNENWVAKCRKKSFIQFWSESVDSFSKAIEERGKEIYKNVKQHKNALAVWENADKHLKKAEKEKEEIGEKITDEDLDENYNKISIINSEYDNARIEFEKAQIIVEEEKTLKDEDLIDNSADDKVEGDTIVIVDNIKINKSKSDTEIKTEEKSVTLKPSGSKFKTLLFGLVIGIILSVGGYFVYEKINESFTDTKSPFTEEIEYINNWFKDTDNTSKTLTSRCEKLAGCLAEESWGKAYDSLAVANNIRNEIDDIDLYKADSVTLDEIIQKTKVADSHYKKSEIFLDNIDLTTETNELFIKARTDRKAIQELKNKFSQLHLYIALKEGSSKPQTITESFDIFFGPVYKKEYIIGETHNITKVSVDNKNKQILIVLEKIN